MQCPCGCHLECMSPSDDTATHHVQALQNQLPCALGNWGLGPRSAVRSALLFALVVGVPGRVAVNAMAVGEPGLASKPASPVAGPTQVSLGEQTRPGVVAWRLAALRSRSAGLGAFVVTSCRSARLWARSLHRSYSFSQDILFLKQSVFSPGTFLSAVPTVGSDPSPFRCLWTGPLRTGEARTKDGCGL